MRRVVATAAAILACVLGLAACGSSTEGGDKNVVTADSSAAPDGSAAPDSKGGAKTGTPLANTDPCSLLKPSDVPELEQDSSTAPKADGRRCEGPGYSVTLSEVDAEGYAVQFEGSIVKPIPDIAGYKAGTTETTGSWSSSCAVILAVTTNQLVYVAVSNKQDPSKNCDIAKKAATAIAGRIPR
ncbi:DUF3558 family protein [Amycolatopsis circi]|uniref:DUF3558 family protein n=1 Tax=Amycolatopsis circi TaxID=871959 RepID=UPI001FC8F145|nr:DUF3558 family protein [Amycolatopsis circi]